MVVVEEPGSPVEVELAAMAMKNVENQAANGSTSGSFGVAANGSDHGSGHQHHSGGSSAPPTQRTVHCARPEMHHGLGFASNFVRTAKYTKVNFIPKNLFEQFRRLSNAWFLIMAAFQIIPEASVSNGVPTIFFPLGVVIASTMLREAVEDYRRHKADNEMNATMATCLSADGTKFESAAWRDLLVGQIIRINKDEAVPADMVLLATNSPEGIAYIQTSNIDGETNLKFRQAPQETWTLTDPKSISSKLVGTSIICELPNNRVHTFAGSMLLSSALSPSSEKSSLTIKNLLLRGARLQNTDWALGVIVYTGNDTKVRQNAAETPSKRSQVERQVNGMVAACLVLQFTCCILVGILAAVYNDQDQNVWYLDVKGKGLSTGAIGAYAVITAILILQDVVPIAIFISMDIAKTFQSTLINNDLHMYYEEEDAPAIARTSNLNESLGQVKYLFSDKTGTLTCNQMKFKACSVNGIQYGMEQLNRSMLSLNGDRAEMNLKALNTAVDFTSVSFAKLLETGNRVAEDFARCLAVCHTIIPEVDTASAWGVALRAESPDETALVSFAGAAGFRFRGRNGNFVTVERREAVFSENTAANGSNNSSIEKFEILATLEFSSARKRMSVVARDERGKVTLYTKGADSILKPLLNPHAVDLDVTQAHLDDFGRIGLRTLLVASRTVEEKELVDWMAMWQAACNAIDGREEKMETVAALMEQKLELLGATAIEDRLQDGVPETIAKLRSAGISVWMLTGDKLETAINIGRGCRLLDPSTDPIILAADEEDNAAHAKLRHTIESALLTAKSDSKTKGLSVVVDGPTLTTIMGGNKMANVEGNLTELAQLFFNLGTLCHTVICCRVSPLQKALVVRLVATHVPAGTTTLGIGDGANDVPMIQSAHVGVGIMGKEGLQAVLSSDYALAQFRFLQDLLLVHGHWSYRRVTTLILYIFYKSLSYALTQFWLNPFCHWTMQPLYNIFTQMLFSVVFSAVPVICYAVFEQDVVRNTLLNMPSIYTQGQLHMLFNMKRFLSFVKSGLIHSVICTIFPLFLIQTPSTPGGDVTGLRSAGNAGYTVLVFCVNMKMALASSFFAWPNVLALSLSVLLYIFWELLLGEVILLAPDDYKEMYWLMGTGMYYLVVLLSVVTALFIDYSSAAVIRLWFPDPIQITNERAKGHTSGQDPENIEMQPLPTVRKSGAFPSKTVANGFNKKEDPLEDRPPSLPLSMSSESQQPSTTYNEVVSYVATTPAFVKSTTNNSSNNNNNHNNYYNNNQNGNGVPITIVNGDSTHYTSASAGPSPSLHPSFALPPPPLGEPPSAAAFSSSFAAYNNFNNTDSHPAIHNETPLGNGGGSGSIVFMDPLSLPPPPPYPVYVLPPPPPLETRISGPTPSANSNSGNPPTYREYGGYGDTGIGGASSLELDAAHTGHRYVRLSRSDIC